MVYIPPHGGATDGKFSDKAETLDNICPVRDALRRYGILQLLF
jgi:hypothetical protein